MASNLGTKQVPVVKRVQVNLGYVIIACFRMYVSGTLLRCVVEKTGTIINFFKFYINFYGASVPLLKWLTRVRDGARARRRLGKRK